MKAPISLCLIAKNEEPRIEACLKSFRDYVEEIVVVDTGSSDKTPEIAKKYADIFETYTDCNDPATGYIENFAQARQRSFDLGTKRWKMWADCDDRVLGAAKLLEIVNYWDKAREDKPCMITFPYEYAHDGNGNPIVRQYRERLFCPASEFEWTSPVHETCNPKQPFNTVNPILEDLTFIHNRGNKVIESFRNLRILKKYIEKVGESDARQLYYIGLEYGNANEFDNMIKYLTRYLELSGWEDEKVMACLRLAHYYLGIADYEKAISIAFKAITNKENWSEPYFILAKAYYFLAQQGKDTARNWQRCAFFAKQGLSFPPTRTLLFVNPLEREYEIHRYLNVALCNIGDTVGALESVKEGLKKVPDDNNLLSNKLLYETHIFRNELNELLNSMRNNKVLSKIKYDSVINVLDNKVNLPSENKSEMELKFSLDFLETSENLKKAGYVVKNNNKEIIEAYLNTVNKNESSLDIVFYVGDGLEIYSPETIKKTGMGGSELMAMQMAKGLANLGHRVRYYGGVNKELSGIYEGVEYHTSDKYKNINCDVLICSRFADKLDSQFNINAKLKILWCHDVVAINAQHKFLLEANRIFALSKWHKDYLVKAHNLHPDHIIVTRNAIDINRFKNKTIKRNKYKVINSSSPDRSWFYLLDCWEDIKTAVPEAECHLYYGFDNWEKVAPYRPGEVETIQRLKNKINELANKGVVFHGRIGQEELANEMLSAGVAAYRTNFTETSCLSMMEATAAGLRIITSDLAALSETVADRGVLIAGDCSTKEYREQFIAAVINALKKDGDEDREKLQKYADEHFSWENLVKSWHEIFHQLINEVKVNPIVPYQPVEEYWNK